MWGQFYPGGSFPCTAQKTISITVRRFYDFVRLSIAISFQIMFSSSTHEWHPYYQICVGPRQIITMQPINKKFKCFFNNKLNVRTGFLDPENMGKDTKTDFLSQILRKLWGIEYLAHLAQMPFHFLLIWQKSCPRVLEWHFSDSRSYDISSKWCQVWYIK